jgi:putative transposase
MATYTQIFYHIVYSTKYRNPYMDRSNRDLLFKFIWGVLNKKSVTYIESTE